MALQSSGAISLSDIQTEFGGSNPISLSEYYRGGAYTTGNNTGVPTSGQIQMDDFYGATKQYTVTVLLVAGGGGGGTSIDGRKWGAGGAGGVLYGTMALVPSSYGVTIGNGGAAAPNSNGVGYNGGNSVFNGATAIGGGGGRSHQDYYNGGGGGGSVNGGSGGGHGGVATQGNSGGLTGYGSNGGPFTDLPTDYGMVGGGGAGGAGGVGYAGAARTLTVGGTGYNVARGGNARSGTGYGDGGPRAGAGYGGVLIISGPNNTVIKTSSGTVTLASDGTLS